ncbi:hypothetical protein BH10PLA1_BH10PLA1_22750 [soil metagenome]
MILVVDDHADTRLAIVQLLKFDGYDAIAVSSGSEALAFLTHVRPKLLLIDYSMPDMTGLDVLAQMKKDERLAILPVIMFSAHGEAARQEALRAGVSSYIMKASLDWSKLSSEVARLAGPPASPRKEPVAPDVRIKEVI